MNEENKQKAMEEALKNHSIIVDNFLKEYMKETGLKASQIRLIKQHNQTDKGFEEIIYFEEIK